MNADDEFFSTPNDDLLSYDDEIFSGIDDIGITSFRTHSSSTTSHHAIHDDDEGDGDGDEDEDDIHDSSTPHHLTPPIPPMTSGNSSVGGSESLKLRLKVPGIGLSSLLLQQQQQQQQHQHQQKKRGRKPKRGGHKMKLGGGGSIKMKKSSSTAEKRKYTKRKMSARESSHSTEDTSNLRRSARPPQASRAFDDHYLL